MSYLIISFAAAITIGILVFYNAQKDIGWEKKDRYNLLHNSNNWYDSVGRVGNPSPRFQLKLANSLGLAGLSIRPAFCALYNMALET